MNRKNIIKKVRENGVCKVENFLVRKNFLIAESILNKRVRDKGYTKGHLNTFFYRSDRRFLFNKLLNLEISKFIDSLKLIKLAKKLKLNDLANKILGSKSKLTTIDSYLSPRSHKPVLDWHVDQAYSGRPEPKQLADPAHTALKFFIYLTPVDSNNGCLGYIPKSNRIAYQLKKAFLKKDLNYKPYWMLKDFRNILKDPFYFSYLKKKMDGDLIKSFIKDSKFIEKKPFTTNKFDNKLDKGGAIIFDESGAHIGSKPSKHDRLVLRYFYKISAAPSTYGSPF